jgi:hypothetical protein
MPKHRVAPEEWRAIPGYENRYEASTWGRIRSVPRTIIQNKGDTFYARKMQGKILVPSRLRRSGHLHVQVGRNKTAAVHQLVMLAFIGPCPAGKEVAHNNGKPGNNYLYNLRYDTTKGNQADKLLHGTHNRGQRNHRAILTEAQVREIRITPGTEESLGKKFGVSPGTIGCIRRGRNWAWLK